MGLLGETVVDQTEREVRRRLVKSFLDIVILKMMRREPLSGYELMQRVYDRLGVLLSPGTIYPILRVLHQRSLVNTEKISRKTRYRLTDEGSRHLDRLFEYYTKHSSTL